MNKGIVFLFDGTSKTADQEDEGFLSPTNVKKFKDAIACKDNNPKIYYAAGVGTRINEDISGAVWGSGISDRLQEAYRFITHEINSITIKEPLKIYILGFSRGAYIARVFSWLLYRCGIPDNASDCENRYKMFDNKEYDKLNKLDNTFPELKIEMLGVWDTVKTAIYRNHNDEELSPVVNAGYHAMSIDEKREKFPVLKWKNESRVKQIWFAGVHSDVGGGYKEAGLSDIALQWMLYNAIDHGLNIRGDYKINPNSSAVQHDSYSDVKWKLMGTKIRTIESSELAHNSVKKRIAEIIYSPENLPKDIQYVE